MKGSINGIKCIFIDLLMQNMGVKRERDKGGGQNGRKGGKLQQSVLSFHAQARNEIL